MEQDTAIARVILHYHPEWVPPSDRREWVKTLCPFHGESNPSATVSYRHNAFRCFGCDMKGDTIGIIRKQEGVTYAEAVRKQKEILVGCDIPVPAQPPGKSRRRVFGESGSEAPRVSREVRSRVRGRSSPWS